MSLNYLDLDGRTRKFMIEEIDRDTSSRTLYLSPWLTDEGLRVWARMLRIAAESHDDGWLAAQLRFDSYIRKTAERRKPKGDGYTTYRVPDTAADTLAEGEFNRFYVRALCLRAITDGEQVDGGMGLVVYRAKPVKQPSPGSEEKIGIRIDPQAFLNDLRANQGVEPALGLPPGPNSGLSIRIVRDR
jgi:hypothetical protein